MNEIRPINSTLQGNCHTNSFLLDLLKNASSNLSFCTEKLNYKKAIFSKQKNKKNKTKQ